MTSENTCASTATDNPNPPCCGIDNQQRDADGHNACTDQTKPQGTRPWYRHGWHGLSALTSVWSAILAIPLIVYLFDGEQFPTVMQISTDAFLGTLPFIIFAVLSIAYLKATGAETLVAKAFEGKTSRMIVFAALFGGLAPFCSCEVIPFIAGLLAIGVPLPAVMAFWLSSPLIDPPALLITAGALGWHFAIAKMIAAVSLGLLGGFLLQSLAAHPVYQSPLRHDRTAGGCCGSSPKQPQVQWAFWHDTERQKEFSNQFRENAVFLVKWLCFAYLLEALLILYIPASMIASIVGGEGLGSITLGALVGMPAYLNSYAAPPLVAGLMEQGMSPGSAMAFMIAGAISSIPAMTAVWSLVKKPVFFTYLGMGLFGAILLGYGFEVWVNTSP
ncbi:MAG: permease [Pseudomonadales bacterium]|nr:permease [Pseudomonadales bacterium]